MGNGGRGGWGGATRAGRGGGPHLPPHRWGSRRHRPGGRNTCTGRARPFGGGGEGPGVCFADGSWWTGRRAGGWVDGHVRLLENPPLQNIGIAHTLFTHPPTHPPLQPDRRMAGHADGDFHTHARDFLSCIFGHRLGI